MWEVREEVERQKAAAAKATQEEVNAATKEQADEVAKAQADVAAKERADAVARARAEKAIRGQALQLVIPLRSAPPVSGTEVPTGGAGDK